MDLEDRQVLARCLDHDALSRRQVTAFGVRPAFVAEHGPHLWDGEAGAGSVHYGFEGAVQDRPDAKIRFRLYSTW